MQQSDSGVNPQAKVSEIEKAWLAGIIDGEGSIRIDYPRKEGSCSPRVVVTNNDWAIIEKVADICQRLDCNPHISQRKGKRSWTKDVLILGMTKILILLPAIMPYLTGKKEKQALIMYRFCSSRKGMDVNSLPNRSRSYSSEEIQMVYEIQSAMHTETKPQRLYAKP